MRNFDTIKDDTHILALIGTGGKTVVHNKDEFHTIVLQGKGKYSKIREEMTKGSMLIGGATLYDMISSDEYFVITDHALETA